MTPYEEGLHDYNAGCTIFDCPYQSPLSERAAWLRGFQSGMWSKHHEEALRIKAELDKSREIPPDVLNQKITI